MNDFYGVHFDYASRSSREFGLLLCSAESTRFLSLCGEISGTSVFVKNTKKRIPTGDDYSESPISFEIDIITEDQRCLTISECRQIEKWLFNRQRYNKLYIDEYDDCDGYTSEIIDSKIKRLFINCRFINPSYIEAFGGICGYHVTIEADSGYWWQDAITKEFALNLTTQSATKTFYVNVDSDIDDYIYPKVTITVGAVGGGISLINKTDDPSNNRKTKFTGISPNTTFTINSQINYISQGLYTSFEDRNFPRLLDGSNMIYAKGNISTITFEYNNRRFL